MDLHEMINRARTIFRDGVGNAPVVAIAPDGTTFSIKEMVAEEHVDGDGSVTVWLKIEEN